MIIDLDNNEHYKGREHSGIKHLLLESYLGMLFMIIGQHEKRIAYVDCFSGPWQEADENLSGTSIALSLDVMRKCRHSLQELGHSVDFRALFVEKNTQAHQKLDTYLSNLHIDGIRTNSMNGDFYELRNDILKWCGNDDFVFFFIDPKGWKNKIEIPTLKPLLQRPKSEFMINFMYDFLVRTHTQSAFQEDMAAIFGKVPDTAAMDSKEREDYLISQYRNGLKTISSESRDKLRAAYVSIQDPVKDRTKYHLVYLTRHPLGLIKFMGASEKMDIVQQQVRVKTKQQRRIEATGQGEMFEDTVDQDDVNSVDLDVVKQYWLNHLTDLPKQYGYEDLADILEETNWFETNLQQAFNELIEEGKAVNLDATKKRPKKPVHFNKKERLQRTLP